MQKQGKVSVLKPKNRDNLDNINLKEQKIIQKSVLPILHHNIINLPLLKIYKNYNKIK
jgi:hypothetical protein